MGNLNDNLLEFGITNPIVLDSPILINGEKRTELSWSADDVTVDLYDQACKQAAEGTATFATIEVDNKLHRLLGCAAIIAVNSEIDFNDLKQLKGADIFKVGKLGRFFAIRSGASEESISESASDSTPESSTPAQKKSKNDPS